MALLKAWVASGVLAAGLALWLGAGGANPLAADAQPGVDAGAPRVQATASTSTVAIGDTFTVNLSIQWSQGVEVRPLALGDRLGGFVVRDIRPGATSVADGQYSQNISVVLTTFESGLQTVPPVQILYRDADGGTGVVASRAVEIAVDETLPEDAADIRDIKGPVGVPKRWKDLILSYVLMIGLVAGAAASVLLSVKRKEEVVALLRKVALRIAAPLLRILRYLWVLIAPLLGRRPRPLVFDIRVDEPDLVPAEAALRELDRIEALGLAGRGMIKEHYTLVSETLRRYIERQYGVLAMESPTSFTLAALADMEIGGQALGIVATLLEEGDLVKFAKFIPAEDAVAALLARARDLVRMTASPPAPGAQVPIPEAPGGPASSSAQGVVA